MRWLLPSAVVVKPLSWEQPVYAEFVVAAICVRLPQAPFVTPSYW